MNNPAVGNLAPILLVPLVVFSSGCASRDPARANEAGGLVVASSVAVGSALGVAASPITVPLAMAEGRRRREMEAKLDPIYSQRSERLRSRDPIGDAARVVESGVFAFLPSVPGGSYYPGLPRGALGSPSSSFPIQEENLAALRRSALLSEVMQLAGNDPSHPTGPDSPPYFSPTYRAFLEAGMTYKTIFNEAMLRRMKARQGDSSDD